MKQFCSDLIESGAIYYIVVGLAIAVVGSYIELLNFNECRAHGFSFFYCFTK